MTKTQKLIEKKGYNIRFNMGYKNGIQTIISVSAWRGNHVGETITEKSLSKLLYSIRH